jgi:hypothetical protein
MPKASSFDDDVLERLPLPMAPFIDGERLLQAEFHRQQQLLDFARRKRVLKIGAQNRKA